MMARVKICGLAREEDVRLADALGASFLGFVFAPSERRVSPEHAASISQGVRAARVAVVVDPTEDELDCIASVFAPDYVQFHGGESPERVLRAGSRWGFGTIKAVGVGSDADLKRAGTYAACDLVLLDAKPDPDDPVRGGHGRTLPWELVAGKPRPKEWVLAGGLTPDNVAEAVRVTHASVVDTASGVESAPGVKEPARLRAFFHALSGEALHA